MCTSRSEPHEKGVRRRTYRVVKPKHCSNRLLPICSRPPTLKIAVDHPLSWGRVLPGSLDPDIKSIHTTAPIYMYSQLFWNRQSTVCP
eukprot:2687418-Prymnesium_polylepis.1